MISVKKSTIFCSVFFSKIGLEIMLNSGLERKEAFEDPWFRSKNPDLFLVCFSAK